METESININKCFKFNHHVFGNLNIAHCTSNSVTVLWNKFQIFIYDKFQFDMPNKIVEPEFDIFRLVVSNNQILCLDFSGNIHSVLKFKHPTQRILKAPFQPLEQNLICIDYIDLDHIYSVKLISNTLMLCHYRINLDFATEMQVTLNINVNSNINQEECILHTYLINESEFLQIKSFLNIENVTWNQQLLHVMSFDKLTLYVLLCSNKSSEESLTVIKLYTCPAKICNFTFSNLDNLNLLVSLAIGVVIKIPLFASEKEPLILHLNSSINKSIWANNNMIYTDGINLWKTNVTFTDDIRFIQFVPKNIKDFILVDNQIICTTYYNLIYLYHDNEASYIKQVSEDYCSTDIVLNNSDCLKKIMEQTEKSKNIVSKINKLKNCITTLAMSTRRDVMDDILNYNITVHEQFEHILKENIMITLIDNIKEYYDSNVVYILVKISTTSLQQKFHEILSSVFCDLKIQILLKSKIDVLKMIILKADSHLKRMNIVIPLPKKAIRSNKIHIFIKLITKLPGIFVKEQPVWTILHQNHIVLNSEHFIKSYKPNSNIVSLNENPDTIEDLIHERAENLYGHLLKFNKVSNKDYKSWSLYLKLPENYIPMFKKEEYVKNSLGVHKAEILNKQITQDQFLKAKSEICLDIGTEVKLEIINDGISSPLLKISSDNLNIAFDIKLFFSKLLYASYKELEPGSTFVDQALYSSIENLEQRMKKLAKNKANPYSEPEEQEFSNLFEQHQKILGSLLI